MIHEHKRVTFLLTSELVIQCILQEVQINILLLLLLLFLLLVLLYLASHRWIISTFCWFFIVRITYCDSILYRQQQGPRSNFEIGGHH